MGKKNNRPKMAKILKLEPAAIIKVTSYIGKVVGVIDIAAIKTVLTKQLPKHDAKVRTMYDYGNCIA